jgi:hypothetical protein
MATLPQLNVSRYYLACTIQGTNFIVSGGIEGYIGEEEESFHQVHQLNLE